MRSHAPKPVLMMLASSLVWASACGRLGFEANEAAVDERPGSSDGESDAGSSDDGDGAPDGPGDGDGDGEPSDAGPSDVDAQAGDGDAGGDGDGSPSPVDAGRDAGDEPDAADAGMPVPYPLPAPLRCGDYASVVACDDFSGSRAGSAVLGASSAGNDVRIADGFATTTSLEADSRAAVQSTFSAVRSGELYLRFSLYVPGDLPLYGVNIATFGVLATDGDFGLDLNLEQDALELYTTGDGFVTVVPHSMPRDRWTCVMLKVENVDSQSGSVRVLIDGDEVLSTSNVDTEPSSGITGAAAGVDWAYDGQPATTLYVDNFLVTRAHPGDCP